MTLYAISDAKGVREDNFAWYERDKGKYWFNGVTLTEEGWVPNPISLNKYYVMTSDLGIGIQEDKIVLMKNGEGIVTVHVDPNKTKLSRYNKLFHWATAPELIRSDPGEWSTWYEIKGLLRTVYPSQDSEKILSAMNKWEEESLQTVLWVEKTMKDQAESQDMVEIYAAGYQWLWHNATKGVITTGYKKKVWGSVHLHSGGAIIARGASPIHNGWLVGLDRRNKYLLRWNGHNVEMSAFVFPYGPWANRGIWRLWYWEPIVLTPLNRLVMVPEPYYYFKEDYLDWVCFSNPRSGSDLLLINRQGELLRLDLSEYPGFEKTPAIYPRERCMLVKHVSCIDDHEWLVFSLINISPTASVERAPKPLWQIKVTPLGGARVGLYYLYIKDGATEVFAFTFDACDEDWMVGLINERGQFWLSPFSVKEAILDYYVDADGAIKYDRFVVMPSERFSMFKASSRVIRVSDGQVYIELASGVTMSDPMTSFPDGKNNLWPYLVSALGLERLTKKRRYPLAIDHDV